MFDWGFIGENRWISFPRPLLGSMYEIIMYTISGRAGGGGAWLGHAAALGWTQEDGKIPHFWQL